MELELEQQWMDNLGKGKEAAVCEGNNSTYIEGLETTGALRYYRILAHGDDQVSCTD